jgi:FkbM family methyltransferase
MSTGVAGTERAGRPGAYVRWERQLPWLLSELRVPAEGVVQVGAHTGQEVAALTRCGFRRMVLIEPNPEHIGALDQELSRHHAGAGLPPPPDGRPPREIVLAAAGREHGRATLYVTEYDQQASPLPPLPPMSVVRQENIAVVPVRDVQHGCNVLVVDAQGTELDVLAGADLRRLQLAVVEGSAGARYSGGSTLKSIADYMRARGWRPVARWAHANPDVVDVAWLAPRAARAGVSGPPASEASVAGRAQTRAGGPARALRDRQGGGFQ